MKKTIINKLTLSQIKYLLIIGENKGLSISDISKKLQITKQSASRMVSKLESFNLVIKNKSNNVLSEDGEIIFDKYKKNIDKVNIFLEQKKIDNINNSKSIIIINNFNKDDINKLILLK